ncbi:MAG: Gfo/Idh/MocA family protein [Promethearchaeota archaeon]
MSEKPLNIFVVGTKFGATWMEAAQRNPHWNIVGCAAKTEKSIKSAGKKFNIPKERLFTDFEKALEELSDIDAVAITTPNYLHYKQSKAVLEKKFDLILEKPIVETWEEAISLIKLLRNSGKKACVGQTLRGELMLRLMAHHLNKGIIGKIHQLNFQSHWFWNPFDNWRFNLRNMFLDDIGIHQIDTIRMLLNNRKCLSVYAQTYNSELYPIKNINTTCSGLWIMEDNIRVNYFGSMGLKGQELGWYGEIKVFGEKGSVYRDPYSEPIAYLERKIAGYKKKGLDSENINKILPYSEYIKIPYILEDFYHAIIEDRPPITDLNDNIHSFAILLGMKKSSDENRVITIQKEYPIPKSL